MLKDARDAKDVAEAARLLRQARTNLIYVHSNQTAAHGRIGDRERRIQETLQRVTNCISSAYRELEKLAPRRSDRSLLNFPHEPPPQKVKWGGGRPRSGSMRRLSGSGLLMESRQSRQNRRP